MFVALAFAVQASVKSFQLATPAELPRDSATMKVHFPFVTNGEDFVISWRRCHGPHPVRRGVRGVQRVFLMARIGRDPYCKTFMGSDVYA